MLQPKNTKFRKLRKVRIKKYKASSSGVMNSQRCLNFGTVGLRACEGGWITARQIEAARKTMRRKMKRAGRIWICVFPDRPVTRKAIGVRMGKGKGSVSFWVFPVKAGQIIFELGEISSQLATQTLKSGAIKLPVQTKIVQRN